MTVKRSKGEQLFLGAIAGFAVGLSQLFIGPFLALLLVLMMGALFARTSLVLVGGHLLAAGSLTLAIYVSALVFGCGGGTAAHDGDGRIISCIGSPSIIFIAIAAIAGVMTLVGLLLVVSSARREAAG
jgi:hypothetical protein